MAETRRERKGALPSSSPISAGPKRLRLIARIGLAGVAALLMAWVVLMWSGVRQVTPLLIPASGALHLLTQLTAAIGMAFCRSLDPKEARRLLVDLWFLGPIGLMSFAIDGD